MTQDESSKRSFFERVWLITLQIPPGKVTWYSFIAELLDAPHAARTVGWALHALTPEQARWIPWHRVINKSGRCSLRNASYSHIEQQALLEEEGVQFDERGYTDLTIYGWEGLTPEKVQMIFAEGRLPWELNQG